MMNLTISNPIVLTMLAFVLACAGAGFSCLSFRLQKGMIVSLVLLPPVVCAALLAINGSLGVSMAILGVFGLVRFRSLPGSSTDIVSIFYAMVIGLLASTGLVTASIALTLMIGLMFLIASRMIGRAKPWMEIRITAPENITSIDIFEKILNRYGQKVRLEQIRTSGMGSVYELRYVFKPAGNLNQLEMMDQIRAENCNMTVVCSEICQENSQL